MAVRAAIFDLDGTLIDSKTDIACSANHARQAVGLSALPIETVASYVGDGVDPLIERLIPTASDRRAAKAAFSAHYADHCCDTTTPYEGMIDSLGALRDAGWTLAVATNKPSSFAAIILRNLGLGDFFGDRIRGGDLGKKPDPATVLAILQQTQADPRQSWMIGDHHTDIRAGQAAGIPVLWCEWGIGHQDGLSVQASIAHPRDIPAALARADL